MGWRNEGEIPERSRLLYDRVWTHGNSKRSIHGVDLIIFRRPGPKVPDYYQRPSVTESAHDCIRLHLGRVPREFSIIPSACVRDRIADEDATDSSGQPPE